MKKTRKQHFVPQFYLRHFAIPESRCDEDKDKCRVHVFDKANQNSYPAQIGDIAQKAFFYDFALDDFAAKHFPGEDPQVVEHKLGDLESHWATQLAGFLGHADTEPINDVEMCFFSNFLLLQLIRTSEFRVLLEEANSLTASAASQRYIDEQHSPEIVRAVMNYFNQRPALVQAKLMFDSHKVNAAAKMLLNHIWVVGINNTDQPLYTSDHPVVRKANIPHPSMGGGCGIDSRGIEIAFPLSPTVLLMLFDRTAFHKIIDLDKTIMLLTSEFVDIYNSLQVMQSHRHIFSSSYDFSLASDTCRQNPSICQPNRQRIQIQKVSL